MEERLKDRVTQILEHVGPNEELDPEPEPEPEPEDSSKDSFDGRFFSLGLFLVSIFLVSLAAVLPVEDRYFWAGWAGIILVAAAWQWDRNGTQRRR